MKPIIINGYTELCPKCKTKVKFAEPTGTYFQGASESYYDWCMVTCNYCPNCGEKIIREAEGE